jgi:hypothetical protein
VAEIIFFKRAKGHQQSLTTEETKQQKQEE